MMETAPRLNLVVHHLRFTLEAMTSVDFGVQAGAQIRGALWEALRTFACTSPEAQSVEHRQHCPMCRLLAFETMTGERGSSPPRPFAIRPPLPEHRWNKDNRRYSRGEPFTIGVNLFGNAAELFPYVCQAVYRMGEIGSGYGRGRFLIQQIEAVHPFTGETTALYDGRRLVGQPDRAIGHDDVMAAAARLPVDRTTLRFLTPAQITGETQSKGQPTFHQVVSRLIERCQAMEKYYSDTDEDVDLWRGRYLTLTEQALDVCAEQSDLRQVHVFSGSRRSGYRGDIGGLVGEVTYMGNLAPFRYWLLWGMALHIGKNAVKGNGWYEIAELNPI